MLPQPHWFVLLNVVFLTALPNIPNYTKQAFFFFCSSPFRGFQAFHEMRGMNQSTTNQSTYCPLRNLHQNLNQDCMLFTTYFNGIHTHTFTYKLSHKYKCKNRHMIMFHYRFMHSLFKKVCLSIIYKYMWVVGVLLYTHICIFYHT